MIKAIKIRLKPTKEQEALMLKSCGIARFAYNWGLNKWKELHSQGIKPYASNIKKEFNNTIRKDPQYNWLYEVSSNVTAQAFNDLQNAYNNFFKGLTKYPQLKSKKKSKQSFYVRYDAIKFNNNKVNIEKIGKVEYKYNKDMPKISKYVNPRCSFDGKYWYLSFGYELDKNNKEVLRNIVIGIDLGVKDLAVTSIENLKFKNINKSSQIRKITKRLKRLQRQVSKKYIINKQGNKFVKTNNIIKLEKQIRLIRRKLKNIRLNHIHQATSKIVKTKPSRVVMETLNIKDMMKNKHLSRAIHEQRLYEFKRQMKYKCEFNGIEFVEADKWYPSSKTCSGCGHIKKDLKLSDRVYICTECSCVIDRDYNAAINLSRYSA